MAASRRSSVRSSGSSQQSRAPSNASGDAAGVTAATFAPPVISGNLQMVSTWDCGETVVTTAYSDDGSAVGKCGSCKLGYYLVVVYYQVSQQSSASAAGGMIDGQVRVFNTTTGAMTVLENEDIVQDK